MDDATLQGKFAELFAGLPTPVQKAISSSDVEKHLREIATANKLHIDQGEKMETQVLLSLFGIKPIEQLQENLRKELGVSGEAAAALAADVSRVVFEPIRQELERKLEHPEAKEKEVSSVDAARTQVLSAQQTVNSEQRKEETTPVLQPVPVVPATPPPPPPTEKAIRMPASGAYVPGETSVARKDIHDDPYRESPA